MEELKIVIEIPQFIRRVKLSEKQRAKYFEWNGITIKGKGKKLPISFYKDKKNIPLNTDISHLKDDFFIGIYKNNKFISMTRDLNILPNLKQIQNNYNNNKKYNYKLCTIKDNLIIPVLCNPKTVNTPKWYLIKGQDIYSGVINEHQRGFVMSSIKNCYLPYIKPIPVINKYPIKIDCFLYDTIKNFYDKSKEEGQRWDVDNFMYPYLKAFPDLLVAEGKIKDDDRLHLPSTIKTEFIPIKDHHNRKLVFIITEDKREEIKEIKEFFNLKNANTYESEDLDLIKDNEPIW
jgi:hypothetical protein